MAAIISGIWQCFLIISLGATVSRYLRLSVSLGERVALSAGLGAVASSAIIFLLLLAGGFHAALVVPIFVTLTLICVRDGYSLLKQSIRAMLTAARANPVLAGIAVLLLLPQCLSALTPEVEVDSLWYHLGVPQFYLFQGRLCEVPFNLPSHYPMNFHLQYVLSLFFGNDMTAKILTVFLFFPICTLIYSTARRLSNRTAAFVAVIVYLSMIHHRVPVMANVQRAVLLFSLLSTSFLWRWMEEGKERDFWISAFWCGIAVGTKFNALIFCLTLHTAAAACWLLIRRNWLALLPWVAGYHAVAWALLSPWMIKSYLYTGNPLYPLLSRFFGARDEYLQAMLSNDRNHGLNFLRSSSFQEFFRQVFHNITWMVINADLLFCLIPFVLLLLCIETRRFLPQLLTGLVTIPLFTFLWGSDVGRLFALTYGIFSILTGVSLYVLKEKRPAGRIVMRLVVICLPATFMVQKAIYCHYPAIDWHGDVHLSPESRINFLLDHGIVTREDLRVAQFAESHLSKDYNLYVYHGGYPFYMQFPKILSDAHFGEMLDQWLAKGGPEEAARRLRELNVGYLLRGPKIGWKNPISGLGNDSHTGERFNAFINQYAESIQKFENQEIFRLRWVNQQG